MGYVTEVAEISEKKKKSAMWMVLNFAFFLVHDTSFIFLYDSHQDREPQETASPVHLRTVLRSTVEPCW